MRSGRKACVRRIGCNRRVLMRSEIWVGEIVAMGALG